MPPPSNSKHTRRRFTENATDSMVAESNDVWHSTRIDDSTLHTDESEGASRRGGVGGTGAGGKSRNGHGYGKNPGSVLQEDNNDRGGGAGGDTGFGRSTGGRGDGAKDKTREAPIVIAQSTGHPFVTGVLQKCGYVIRQPASSNELFYDVMNFRKKLADWLNENEDELKRIETDSSKFLKALNAYLTEHFKTAMKPTKHATELIQPSLLHCLLGIEKLQPHVIKIIMPLLAEAALSTAEEDAQLVDTILNQLKWLPTIVDGQKFADNLMSVVDNAVFTCQSQIIKELPNILPSHLHTQVAEKLLEKFSDEGLQLNIPLMDCFSSLEIPEGFWCSIRNTAVDQMTNAPLRDIPAYFSFLFRIESIGSLNEIIGTIRQKVQLTSDGRNARNHALQVEILEKVGFCITVNPSIVNVWVKQIKEDLHNGLTEEIRKIDLLMLLLFAESHKSAVDVLKILLAETKLAVKLFSQMMDENVAMVNHLFSTTAKILDSLMRSKDTKCSESVQEITVQLFVGLSPMEAQTLMGNMTSILVNFPPSRDLVLSTLTKLAEKESKKLLFFAPYLMNVLDYVMQFAARQIRSLMNILATLSQTEPKNPGETHHFNAEFSILLRKQLTHADIKIRCFGVFGALATIRRMSKQETKDIEAIKQLLKLAWNTVERDEDACGIFFDELAQCVDALPMDICESFCAILKNKFQKLWTLDAADTTKIQRFAQRTGLNLVASFDANRECSEDRLLMMFENQPLEMSPLVIPAHFRVLAVLETKVKNGDLVEIDALLGCPALFPEFEEYYERESMSLISYNQRNLLGQYLALLINFFRESVSAFVNENNSELRIKIWLRLENIIKLQKIMVQHYDSFPALPFAYVADKTIGSSRDGAGPSGLQAFRMAKSNKPSAAKGKSTGSKRKAGVKSKAGKKKARSELPDSENEVEEEEDNTPQQPGSKKTLKISLDEEIQPKKIVPHIRRFDACVFRLLRYPLRCNEEDQSINFSRILSDLSSVSQNPSRIAQVEKFSPEALVLLMTELKHQLSDDKCQLDLFSVRNFLKHICQHVNSIVTVLTENEESGVASASEHLAKLECCLRLLIGLMTSYFECIKKLDKDDQDAKINKAVNLLAMQTVRTEDDSALSSESEILANVSSYLKHLVSFIKDPATALDHLKLLKTIHDVLRGPPEIKMAIEEAAKVYLRNKWKLPSTQVVGFLKIWLGTTPNPIKAIKHLAKKLLIVDESDERAKLPNSTTYTSCTDTNFHVWYNAMFSGLSQDVYKKLRRRGDFDDSIRDWTYAINIFRDLVEVSKNVQRNLILISLLKNCRLFLDAFNSGGVELLPKYFAQSPGEAQKFCKTLQAPCRTIQYICEHSKKKTDMQLLRYVPIVKRVLETLIFRVREVLCAHGGTEAFWVGSLAHRDLRGERIDSQVVAGEDEDLLFSSDEDDIDDAPLSDLNDASDGEEAGPADDQQSVAASEIVDDDSD